MIQKHVTMPISSATEGTRKSPEKEVGKRNLAKKGKHMSRQIPTIESRTSDLNDTNDATEVAEVIPFGELRARRERLELMRAVRQGTYKPDLDALASALLGSSEFYIG